MDAQIVRQDEVSQWVRLLRDMLQGGKKLSDGEIKALAVYSTINKANPLAGEAYYMPGVGPVAGIILWRRKGQEQLDAESKQPGKYYFWCEYEPIEPEGEKFDSKKGDIAYRAVLHDSWTRTRLTQCIVETAVSMKDGLGCDLDTALAKAEEYAGKEPFWEGIGVVYGSETFSYEGRPEKFDRHERCMKRAEKLAIRKRFAGIQLQDAEIVDNGGNLMIEGEYRETDEPIPQPALPATPAKLKPREETKSEKETPVSKQKEGNVIQTFWEAVKSYGIDKETGIQISQEAGLDFELATEKLHATYKQTATQDAADDPIGNEI